MQGPDLCSGPHLVNLELARDVRQLAQVARCGTHDYATNHLPHNSAARFKNTLTMTHIRHVSETLKV